MATKKTTPTFDLKAVPEHHRDQVEALIPSKAVLEAYTSRQVAGFDDFEVFNSARRLAHNVLMAGPTGSGKTTAARAYAAYLGAPFVSVEFNGGLDPASTLGTTQVDHKTGLPQWIDGEITLAARYGPSVIMLDEVNFAPARFTAAFHGMLDARQNLYISELGTRVEKHPQCVVFAAYNPRYRGTNMLNEAFLNRFAYQLEWGYDPDVEEERIGAYSATLLSTVRRMRAEKEVVSDIGTNAMEEFIHIGNDLDIEAAAMFFLNRLQPEDRAICSKVLEAQQHTIAAELGLDS